MINFDVISMNKKSRFQLDFSSSIAKALMSYHFLIFCTSLFNQFTYLLCWML